MTKTTRLQRPLIIALALTAAVGLASCSTTNAVPSTPSASLETTSSAPGATSSASPSAKSSASPSQSAGRRIEISVKGKKVTPSPATVNIAVGESLAIAVTSDKNNTLHAHGFDIAKDLKAGQREEVTIKGAQTGIFEFELHDPELLLFTVAVR